MGILVHRQIPQAITTITDWQWLDPWRTIDDIDLGWKALIKPWYQNNKWLVVDTNQVFKFL